MDDMISGASELSWGVEAFDFSRVEVTEITPSYERIISCFMTLLMAVLSLSGLGRISAFSPWISITFCTKPKNVGRQA